MKYISTFDSVFIFLAVMMAFCLFVGIVGNWHAKKHNELDAWNTVLNDNRAAINVIWGFFIIIGAFNSAAGTTTFLGLCFVVAIPIAVYDYFTRSWSIPKEYMLEAAREHKAK